MEADFSGYVTKAGLKCSDGRTILPGAFKHQDKAQVPLVWQHGHTDPENVLGHVILEHRDDGVYGYGFFNSTPKAQHMKGAVSHKDIRHMSIWANELIERSKQVLHGAIREVSLVLSGANPGALIDNVTIRHADGDVVSLDEEAIIHTGLELVLEHSDEDDTSDYEEDVDNMDHIDDEALSHANDGETIEDVYNSMSDKQKDVLHYMVGEAISSTESKTAKHDNITEDTTQEGADMTHKNVFEGDTNSAAPAAATLSHSDMEGIISDATKNGSLKDAVEAYALQHGIENIDQLFPDAQALNNTPEWLSRRMEWVNTFLSGTRKSPFSRIKTVYADITEDEARAKGYITGTLKKEEFFSVAKRTTTPTTIYKKQKLDRDDMIDITDFDVVTWLKGEMRIMLDEELARAALLGDGRDIAHEDKISESNIRPIAKDHELYTVTVNVNIDDSNSSVQEIIDAIVQNRKYWKGSGLPTMWTTETYIAKFLLLKDTVGRRIYKSLDEVASELRVAEIVPVEVMEEYPSVVAVLVNPADYVLGADKGGQVSMFDDFDIDYNQYKYLIETRVSGALNKLKSAMVVKKVAANLVAVTPNEPAFNGTQVTITNQTGVIYKNGAGTVINAAGSPYAVASGTTYTVNAEPAAGYYFPSSEVDSWEFTND